MMRNKMIRCLVAAAAIMTALPTTGISAENDKELVISFEEQNGNDVYDLTVGKESEFALPESSKGSDMSFITADETLAVVYDAEKNTLKVTASEEGEKELQVIKGSGDEAEAFVIVFKAAAEEEIIEEEIIEAAAPEEITETEEAVPAEVTPAEEAVVPAEETTTEEVAIAEETEEEKLAAGDELVNVADGFVNKDGKNYYYKDNVALTGLQTIKEKQYYFGEDGAMLTGYQFIKEKNKSYFFNEAEKAEDCYAVTDEWKTVDGKKYYFKPNGQAEVGVKTVGNDLYYLNRPAGDAAVGLQVINGRTYFFDNEGKAFKGGWKKVSGKWYFFKTYGAAEKGWRKEGTKYYFLDRSTGAMRTGFVKDGGYTYYLHDSGVMAKGWEKVGNYWYFLNRSTGRMVKGWNKIDGSWYFMHDSGVMARGWEKVNGKWYFLDRNTGKMAVGWKKVDGKWYYFTKSGATHGEGWLKDNGKWYYITKSGMMKTGWLKDERCWYYLKDNGAMASNTTLTINGKSQKFAPDGEWIDWNYLYNLSYGFQIRVNRARCVLTVYGKDYEGNYTIPVWAVTVSVGMDETPTPLGWSTINSKHRWYYYKDDDCWLQYSQFFAQGTKMMHSEAYFSQDPGNMAVGEYYKLGRQASHGCIRMPVIYIKWIYDNCPIGTAVLVYDDWDYAGPYGKPAVPKITNGSAWDPTDPDPRSPYNN